MKVVICEPGQYARIAEIEPTLTAEQKVVGGLIDCVYPWPNDMAALVCNDEGKLNGLPLNRALEDYDVIAGTFFICGISGENFCSLTEEQAARYSVADLAHTDCPIDPDRINDFELLEDEDFLAPAYRRNSL